MAINHPGSVLCAYNTCPSLSLAGLQNHKRDLKNSAYSSWNNLKSVQYKMPYFQTKPIWCGGGEGTRLETGKP